jgi:hypothetical protein
MEIPDKTLLKSKIIEACKKQQSETLANLKREMDEHQQQANEYGPPKDRYDAFRSQMLRRRDIFAEQLQKASEEMSLLDKIKPAENKKKVEFGAVVITDKQKLFISISLGKVSVDNEIYFCISPAVPVYKAMEGLKPGEQTFFNGNRILIEDVF